MTRLLNTLNTRRYTIRQALALCEVAEELESLRTQHGAESYALYAGK